MSSSPTPTDTSPATGATTSVATNNNQLASGTNYFFGFLVAFIAFLFVFLSLGVLARRRRLRLMRDFLLYADDDSPVITQTEPLMWQPSYSPPKGTRWNEIMPLSSHLVQHEMVDKTDIQIPTSRRNPLAAYLGFSPLRTRPRPPDTVQVTDGMRIAVMVQMPQSPAALDDPDNIHEYQIGTVQVPWTDNMVLDPPQT
ncbi:hypothetical protein R3P38DRAFT_1161605 [Favolaschia claudopus]|uniref:Uncharacterized protein n=1 Tax=Favolaschia claudopus TaxID=2862362 RepID=A0AAW0DZL1_9AGAR